MSIYLITYPRQSNGGVVQLTLVNRESETVVVAAAPFFRITGSTVWTVRGDGHIARLTDYGWESSGNTWAGMRFDGPCRLVMGLPRDPSAVSEVLQSVSIDRDVLSVDGVAFAAYTPEKDMWRAASATEKWWHAFRIESAHDYASPPDDASYSERRGHSDALTASANDTG